MSPSLQVDSLLSVKYKWLGKGECQLYPTFFVEKRAGELEAITRGFGRLPSMNPGEAGV